MQRNWLHGFRSLNCRGWIKGGARCLWVCNHVGGLPKLLDSFLSKELYYNLNSNLE